MASHQLLSQDFGDTIDVERSLLAGDRLVEEDLEENVTQLVFDTGVGYPVDPFGG
jgi:hypothetical protein